MTRVRPLSRVAGAAAVLSLGGCVLTHAIDISGPLERPTLVVHDTGMFNLVRACAYGFSVENVATDAVQWAAEADPAACVRGGPVTYGAAPEGFRTTVEAQPLQADVVYRVVARSTSQVPGHVLATYVDGRWRIAR